MNKLYNYISKWTISNCKSRYSNFQNFRFTNLPVSTCVPNQKTLKKKNCILWTSNWTKFRKSISSPRSWTKKTYSKTEFPVNRKKRNPWVKKYWQIYSRCGVGLNMLCMKLGWERKRLTRIINLQNHYWKINRFILRVILLKNCKG